MKRRGRARFIAAYLAPAVILYAVFVLWPVAQAIGLSLFRWRGLSDQKEFVGLANFQELAGDAVFRGSIGHNLFILGVGGAIIVSLSLLLAHALQGESRGVRFLRGIYLFPQIISMVVVSILWSFIYNPAAGLLTGSLRAVGLQTWVQPWLGSKATALNAITVAFVWHALGFYVMLFAAGLKGIPEEVSEAAKLDGAHGLRRFTRITWPMLWSIKRIAAIYLVINSFNVFALVFLVTNGGPDRSTEVMLTYLYEKAFRNNEFGVATALALANFLAILVVSGAVTFFYRRDPQEPIPLKGARA